MLMTYHPMWDDDPGMYPAPVLERHSAICRALNTEDRTKPNELHEMLQGLPDDERRAALDAGEQAIERLWDMTSWSPPDHNPADLKDLRPRLLGSTFTHAALHGGRGGGKSHLIAEVIIELASIGKERVLCCREFQNSISDSARDLLVEKIQNSRFANQWTCLETELRNNATGSKITFMGLARNATAVKSLAGITITWVEEAADISQNSIDLLVPTVTREGNSRLFWTFNPLDDDTPVDLMFRTDEPPERSIVVGVNSEYNPFFYRGKMPGERRSAFNKMSKAKYRHIWRGAIDKNPEGLVFANWTTGRVHVPDDLTPLYGMDHGWTHPFAALEVFVIEPDDPETEMGTIYISAEAYGSNMRLQQRYDAIDEAMPMARKHTIIADSAEPATIASFNDEGFYTIPANKSPGSVRSGITFIQGYRIVVSPDCPNIQSELASYSWKKTKAGVHLRDPEDADNHACDALRYALSEYVPPTKAGVDYV